MKALDQKFHVLYERVMHQPKKRFRRDSQNWWENYQKKGLEVHNTTKHTIEWTNLIKRTLPKDYSKMGKFVDVTKDEILEFGHTAKETILTCEIDTIPCSYRDFIVTQNSRYGNCFTFNHGLVLIWKYIPNFYLKMNYLRTMGDKLRKTDLIGAKNGLKLILNVNQEEYVGILTELVGIRFSIHSAYQTPFPGSSPWVIDYDS